MQQVHVGTWIAPIVIDVQHNTNTYSTRQNKATIEDIEVSKQFLFGSDKIYEW